MRKIRLTQGQVALVDDEDYEWLNKFRWRCFYNKGTPRVIRNLPKRNGLRTTAYLARDIMNAPTEMTVDHINHNPLDNRRVNLRICTMAENMRNRPPNRGRRYKGVFRQSNGLFKAQIRGSGRAIHLGMFSTEEDAAKTYDIKAQELFGEFAYLNFPVRVLEGE